MTYIRSINTVYSARLFTAVPQVNRLAEYICIYTPHIGTIPSTYMKVYFYLRLLHVVYITILQAPVFLLCYLVHWSWPAMDSRTSYIEDPLCSCHLEEKPSFTPRWRRRHSCFRHIAACDGYTYNKLI